MFSLKDIYVVGSSQPGIIWLIVRKEGMIICHLAELCQIRVNNKYLTTVQSWKCCKKHTTNKVVNNRLCTFGGIRVLSVQLGSSHSVMFVIIRKSMYHDSEFLSRVQRKL